MKTHTLANALYKLADILGAQPNIELNELRVSDRDDRTELLSSASIAENVSVLAKMSRIGKEQWSMFISEYKLPIDVRPRDASRDVLGKVLRYLESTPYVLEELTKRIAGKNVAASPELSEALRFLLRRK